MVQDLNMTGHDYNTALFIFFVPYILFEVPSNIIIKQVAPSTWLSIIMVKPLRSGVEEMARLKLMKYQRSGLVGHRYHRPRPGEDCRRTDRLSVPVRAL